MKKSSRTLTLFLMLLFIGSLATLMSGCKDQTAGTLENDGYTVLESDLKIKDTVVGNGTTAKAGDRLKMHYTGTLKDGSKFDSSLDRGIPFTFTLGIGEVIRGWDLGVEGMNVGGKRKLIIPAELGYGNAMLPGIPAGSTLIFEVELLEILE